MGDPQVGQEDFPENVRTGEIWSRSEHWSWNDAGTLQVSFGPWKLLEQPQEDALR